ncbi:Cro/CI family transcriptional regulator [Marinomonas posidonica]|uniref:Cro/CI family transcriptional regulator n=1 Tax=Marinomonas posidonica TaxID=936476 RepID=UPI0037361204
MLKNKVLAFFKEQKQNQSCIAQQLGVSRAAVSAWAEVIPQVQAMRLEKITNGALKYDPSLYESKHKQSA